MHQTVLGVRYLLCAILCMWQPPNVANTQYLGRLPTHYNKYACTYSLLPQWHTISFITHLHFLSSTLAVNYLLLPDFYFSFPHSSTGGVEMEDLDVDDNKAYAFLKSGPTRAQRQKSAQQDAPVSLFSLCCLF